MATTMVNFRMDEKLKKDMENVCAELGMNLSTAITIFAKKVTRERRIPFDVSIDPFYSEGNIRELERRIEDIESGKSIVKEHKLIKE